MLVVSELATNAVQYSGTTEEPPPWSSVRHVRRFVLTLWCLPDHIQIYVFDESGTPPVLRNPSADDDGGRGLHLVDELSAHWGYTFPTPHPSSGKAVWAQLNFPGSPGPTDTKEVGRAMPSPRPHDVPGRRDDPATMMRALGALRGGVTLYGLTTA